MFHYTALSVTEFLTSKGILVVPQPPYSPDIRPCDFFFFHHVSQPYNTAGNVIVLYILVFKFLERYMSALEIMN